MEIDKEKFEKAKEYAVNKMIEKYCKNSDEQTKIALKEFCEAFLKLSCWVGEIYISSRIM